MAATGREPLFQVLGIPSPHSTKTVSLMSLKTSVGRHVDETFMESHWCCINAVGHERPAYPDMSRTHACRIGPQLTVLPGEFL